MLTENADMKLWNKGSRPVGGLNLDVTSNSSGRILSYAFQCPHANNLHVLVESVLRVEGTVDVVTLAQVKLGHRDVVLDNVRPGKFWDHWLLWFEEAHFGMWVAMPKLSDGGPGAAHGSSPAQGEGAGGAGKPKPREGEALLRESAAEAQPVTEPLGPKPTPRN